MITKDERESIEKTFELLEQECEYGMSVYDDYWDEDNIIEQKKSGVQIWTPDFLFFKY